MVLRLGVAVGDVASRAGLARLVCHAVRLLSVLGRATIRLALARRTVDAGVDYRTGFRLDDYAWCNEPNRDGFRQ